MTDFNTIDFNQEYTLLDKKYREKVTDRSKRSQEYLLTDAIQNAIDLDIITIVKGTFSVGGGKEAFVFLGENAEGDPVVVKTFKPYSATNLKRKSDQHHITGHGMASVMAKTEFWNLKILEKFKVNVPKPFKYRNSSLGFSMKLIRDQSQALFEPAPLLKHIDLEIDFGIDPVSFLENILDQIELMFKDATMVHGDLSEFNILVANEKPWIIDVSQSRLYNVKTYTDTPIRIRIDRAIEILERDVIIVLNHFQKKYRVKFDLDDVMTKLLKDLPDFATTNGSINQRNSIKKRMPRFVYIRKGVKVDFWEKMRDDLGWF